MTTIGNLGAFKRGDAELQGIKHDPDALVAMLNRVRADEGPSELRAAIIRAMHRHGSSPAVLAALDETVRRGDHWRERSMATVTLGDIATARARELLEVALQDEDRRVRKNAKLSLAQIRARQAMSRS